MSEPTLLLSKSEKSAIAIDLLPTRGSAPESNQPVQGVRLKRDPKLLALQPQRRGKRWQTTEEDSATLKEKIKKPRRYSESHVIIARSRSLEPKKTEVPKEPETETKSPVGKLAKRKHFRNRSLVDTGTKTISSEVLETASGLSSLFKAKLQNSALSASKTSTISQCDDQSPMLRVASKEDLNSLGELASISHTSISTATDSSGSVKFGSSILRDSVLKKSSNLKKLQSPGVDGKKVQFS